MLNDHVLVGKESTTFVSIGIWSSSDFECYTERLRDGEDLSQSVGFLQIRRCI